MHDDFPDLPDFLKARPKPAAPEAAPTVFRKKKDYTATDGLIHSLELERANLHADGPAHKAGRKKREAELKREIKKLKRKQEKETNQ